MPSKTWFEVPRGSDVLLTAEGLKAIVAQLEECECGSKDFHFNMARLWCRKCGRELDVVVTAEVSDDR